MNRTDYIEIEPPEFMPPQDTVAGVRALIRDFEQNIGQRDLKMSVADYIRLIQLDLELSEEEARNVEVRWIDPVEEPLDAAA